MPELINQNSQLLKPEEGDHRKLKVQNGLTRKLSQIE